MLDGLNLKELWVYSHLGKLWIRNLELEWELAELRKLVAPPAPDAVKESTDG